MEKAEFENISDLSNKTIEGLADIIRSQPKICRCGECQCSSKEILIVAGASTVVEEAVEKESQAEDKKAPAWEPYAEDYYIPPSYDYLEWR